MAGRVEVRQARYFLAVAQTLHFGRAAEQLSMSQPPLSQAILQLERQLGVTLFDRGARTITLTETGRAFAVESARWSPPRNAPKKSPPRPTPDSSAPSASAW